MVNRQVAGCLEWMGWLYVTFIYTKNIESALGALFGMLYMKRVVAGDCSILQRIDHKSITENIAHKTISLSLYSIIYYAALKLPAVGLSFNPPAPTCILWIQLYLHFAFISPILLNYTAGIPQALAIRPQKKSPIAYIYKQVFLPTNYHVFGGKDSLWCGIWVASEAEKCRAYCQSQGALSRIGKEFGERKGGREGSGGKRWRGNTKGQGRSRAHKEALPGANRLHSVKNLQSICRYKHFKLSGVVSNRRGHLGRGSGLL